MLLAFATFVLTTKPADLVETMEQAGFSPRSGYMISSVFQIIPQMTGTMNTIMDAQRSRGMETEGNLLVRARAFIPLISPVVSSSLINTRERAIALEVRGFDSKNKKTFLREHRLTGRDKAFMVLTALLIGFSVVWRVLTWL
jgi:energy-coupling factor transport system permease protein